MQKNYEIKMPTISPSVRQSFWEILSQVQEQVELPTLADENGEINPLYLEMCKVMTEILRHNPDSEIYIAKETLQADLVQEIMVSLTSEHLKLVYENFQKITYEIKSKKAYLRTALYNSAFELESHYANQVNKDLGY